MKDKLRWVIYTGLVLGCGGLVSTHFAQQAPSGTASIPWSQGDLGSAGRAGSLSQTGSVLAVTGSGGDIWGTNDAFHFAYIPWSGDGQFVARINSLAQTHPWAKAGIMIRADQSAGAAHATIAVAPAKGATFLCRSSAGGPTRDAAYQAMRVLNIGGSFTFQRRSDSFYAPVADGPTSGSLPRWLKLVRQGATIRAFDSPDGQNWGWVGTESLDLPPNVLVGLAVSSHDNSLLALAQFDGVQFGPAVASATPAAPVGTGDGLEGSYYNGQSLSGTPVQRVDPVIDFTWTAQGPVSGVGPENFCARWEGDLQAQFSEVYALHLISDDRARLWINGWLVIDEWDNHPETESTALVQLQAGRKYSLRLDFFQGRGSAVARLLWSSPSTPKQTIPQSQLYSRPQDSDADGIPDSWELANGLNPLNPADAGQPSGLGSLTWLQVFRQGIQPWLATQNTNGLPAGWTNGDIGFVGKPGSASSQGAAITASGAGADVWGRSDGLHFVYQPLTGDGQILAKVGPVSDSDPWAKAGLMIRGDLDDGSVNAFLARTPGHGATFQYRAAAGGSTVADFGFPVGDLCWLRLQRQGGVLSAWQSDDGANWQWIGTVALNLPQTVYAGLAVSSHDNSQLAAAQFDEMAIDTVTALPAAQAGSGDGLQAVYKDWTTGATIARVDPMLNFDWDLASPAPGIGATNFSAAWAGVIQAQFTEPYILHLISDDGARLWINGQKVIDFWTDHAAAEATARVNLQAGQYYLVQADYYQRADQAVAQLLWSSPSTARQPIPQSQLYSPQNPAYTNAAQQAVALANAQAVEAGSGTTEAVGGSPGASGGSTNSSLAAPLPAGATNVATVATAAGSAFTSSLGRWAVEGTSAYALDGRGYVEYTLGAPEDNMYQIELVGGAHNAQGSSFAFPLCLSVDGEFLGRLTLTVDGSQPAPGAVQQLTPWLKAGSHAVRVFWDNAAKYVPALEIASVELQTLQGPDSNGNGVADWIDATLRADCGIDVAPSSSLVSPACIEGRGGFLSMMGIAGGAQPQAGAGQRWYANVPLSASGPTAISVSYENGGLLETRQIQWQPTDLLQATNLTVRQGDSLLFRVGQDCAQATINVPGLTNCRVGAGRSAACVFPTAGTYSVSGSGVAPDGTTRSASITVTVVGASLGDPPAVWAQKSRPWNCPPLPAGAILDPDPRLELITLTNASAAALGYGLKIDAQAPRHLLARLGKAGPVLANLRVDGFRLFAEADTYVDVVQTFADGSQLIESGLVLSPLLPQVTVKVEILAGGVTFDDGTLVKELSASDFNELGQATVRFLRPADVQTSVCNIVEAYQASVLVGEY